MQRQSKCMCWVFFSFHNNNNQNQAISFRAETLQNFMLLHTAKQRKQTQSLVATLHKDPWFINIYSPNDHA